MFNKRLLAVGADPEVFFVNKDGTGRSVEGLIEGSKHAPVPMVGLNAGFMIQADNVAAEFNIPPAQDAETFDRSIMQALKYVVGQARKHKCKVAITDVMHFDKKQLSTPHAMTLGCEPDWNVWEGEINPKPKPPGDWRTAAGHVHLSWANPNQREANLVGKAADLMYGVPALLVTEKSIRRELYGKSGCVRFKPYGIEYRSLPNFWIGSKQHRQTVFHIAQEMFARLNTEQDFLAEQLDEYGPEIQHTINTHDTVMAADLVRKFNLMEFKQGEKANVTL